MKLSSKITQNLPALKHQMVDFTQSSRVVYVKPFFGIASEICYVKLIYD
jgi:hypothetical protein